MQHLQKALEQVLFQNRELAENAQKFNQTLECAIQRLEAEKSTFLSPSETFTGKLVSIDKTNGNCRFCLDCRNGSDCIDAVILDPVFFAKPGNAYMESFVRDQPLICTGKRLAKKDGVTLKLFISDAKLA